MLTRSMVAATDAKPPETLTPHEAVLRFFLYQQRISAEDHLSARIALERTVELQPRYGDAGPRWHSCASMKTGAFNPQPNSLDRALHAAERAVGLDPANQLAHYALAVAHYFRGDLGAFRAAAERALALNTRDGNTMAFLGIVFCYSGDWERGLSLTRRAMDLNPHHPGWYRYATFFNEYRQRHYAEALTILQKINLPDYWPQHYTTAMTHAQLGNRSAAKAEVERTLRLWPDFERDVVTGHIEKWIRGQPELVTHIIDGLELAGFRLRRPDGEVGASRPIDSPR